MSTPLNTRQWGLPSGFGQEHLVPIEKIDFSQYDLDQEKVKEMARRSSADMPSPLAAHVGDRFVIQDGHHRVAAAIKRGAKSVKVKVY